MSDEETSNSAPNNKGQQPTPDLDWFLQILVGITNTGSIAFPVTLMVGGLLVSGHLISAKAYFDSFADTFKTGLDEHLDPGEENEKGIVARLRKIGEDVYGSSKENLTKAQKDARYGSEFIHIRNAKIFHPEGKVIPANQGVLWRGR